MQVCTYLMCKSLNIYWKKKKVTEKIETHISNTVVFLIILRVVETIKGSECAGTCCVYIL